GANHVDEVAQLVQARVDALADALLEGLAHLALGAEAPRRARARIVGGEQRGTAGVVADGDDLVEHALLELAVLPALADLVDGEHIDLPQRLEPFAAGQPAREAVADVAQEEEELLVAAAHALLESQLAQHGAQQVRFSRSGRSAEKERARPGGLRHELIDESPRPRERARLLGAVRPVGVERPSDELEWQAQPGEQGQAARFGSAGATANDRIAALVAREDPTGATSAGSRAGVRSGSGPGGAGPPARRGANAGDSA